MGELGFEPISVAPEPDPPHAAASDSTLCFLSTEKISETANGYLTEAIAVKNRNEGTGMAGVKKLQLTEFGPS